MALLEKITKANLKTAGISGLSFTMPAISAKWVEETQNQPADISFDQDSLSLNSGGSNWMAIFSGLLNNVNSETSLGHCLQDAKGQFITNPGVLLRLFPQQILRLNRLVANRFEPKNEHSFERNQGKALRQVPAFLFYDGAGVPEENEGYVSAGKPLGFMGKLRFFDEQGYILHPLYVASLLKALLKIYPILSGGDILSDLPTGESDDSDNFDFAQLNTLIDISTDATTTVRLVKPDGTPHTGTRINGISAINETSGLFSVDAYQGDDNNLQGQLVREEADPSGDFNERVAARFFMGNVTYCRMMDTVPLIICPEISIETNSDEENSTEENVVLEHDFFTVKVVETKPYLIGRPNAEFEGTQLEPTPEIRLHQEVSALPTGNHIMGELHNIFSGEKDKKFCAAVAFDEKLPMPENKDNVFWPGFPKIGAGITPGTSFSANLKKDIQSNSEAKFISFEQNDTADVYVKLVGLPLGSAVRLYNRVFGEDATLKRGNGAGGVCRTKASAVDAVLKGELELVLKNPLGLSLENDPLVLPGEAKLIFDLMITLHDGKTKKLFGALELNIQSADRKKRENLPTPEENALATIGKKSVCKAPILRTPKASDKVFDFNSDDTLKKLLGLNTTDTDENGPKDPPRLITMARRDLLAASLEAGNWKALIGGGRITDQLQNAEQDKGCPGAKGGKETSNAGLYAEKGLLAYDIARMALRRTTNFYERLPELAETDWNEPGQPAPLGETEEKNVGHGTINGAILQNIAPFCETPELALLKLILQGGDFGFPDKLDDWLDDKASQWIQDINDALRNLEDKTDDELDALADDIAPYFEKIQDEIEDGVQQAIEGFNGTFDEFGQRLDDWQQQFGLNGNFPDDLSSFKTKVEEFKTELTDEINRSIDDWKNKIDNATTDTDDPLLQSLGPYIQFAGDGISDKMKTNIGNALDEIMGSFDDLINKTKDWLNGIDGFSDIMDKINAIKNQAKELKNKAIQEIKTKATNWMDNFDLDQLMDDLKSKLSDKLSDLVQELKGLKEDSLDEVEWATRVYNEIKREISASCYGRRDTQWALEEAIKNARDFIYIETPGFCHTGWGEENYTVDLLAKLKTRLEENPALKVIICVPKIPDYSPNYLKWIKNEVKDRFQAINSLSVEQVVCFHPIGFPGRYSNLEQTTVIVDDVWALVGSSSFRRRGLTFDGSSDMVFTDLQQSGGVSPKIKKLRIGLLKQRLGISQDDDSSSQALQLQDIRTTFSMIRKNLIAGGLGKIDRLWKGYELGITYDNLNSQSNSEDNMPAGRDVTNPEGLEFNLWKTGIQAAIARCSV